MMSDDQAQSLVHGVEGHGSDSNDEIDRAAETGQDTCSSKKPRGSTPDFYRTLPYGNLPTYSSRIEIGCDTVPPSCGIPGGSNQKHIGKRLKG